MQFRTSPEGFNRIRLRLIVMTIIVEVLIMAIVLAPGMLSDDPASRSSSFITAILFLLIGAVTLAMSLRQQKGQFLSFVLTINEHGVTRERLQLRTITIHIADIVKIVKANDGSLMIIGSGRGDKVAVPVFIENYDEMLAMLSKIQPITESKTNYQSWSLLATLGMIVILACDFLLTNRIINIISYSLTVIVLIGSIVIVQMSSSIERRIKRMMWIALIPLLSFLLILINLIQG